jgi:acyl-CoA synthetase (AMP-forming)/AMP-acid ligase II
MSTHTTIGDTLTHTAKKHFDRDAVIYPRRDQRWTYAELDRDVNRLANALSEIGVQKGDRVSTMLHNGSEMVLTVYACTKLGAIFNPLNYRLPTGEVEYIVNDAGATTVLYEAATAEAVEEATLDTVTEYLYVPDPGNEGKTSVAPDGSREFYSLLQSGSPDPPETEVTEDDAYAFIYTSGTTGRPKGVVHEHRDMVEHSLLCIAEMNVTKDDVGLSILPLYHCAELHANLFPRVHRGATNVIHYEFDPQATLQSIEDHGISHMFAAPTAWNAVARAAADTDCDVSTLRLGLYGAAPMPEPVLNLCMKHLCRDYVQAYGMTEIGPCGTFQSPEEQLTKQGSAGKATLNHSVRVVEPDAAPDTIVDQGEVGEILISGPCTMREYWNRPEATADSLREAEGQTWYYTGDLGYRDESGYLFVVDRKDDMMISGGENVYPSEVEDVLFSHDGVVEAAVVGEPDEYWGEKVVAYIVGDVDAQTLDAYMLETDRVADFKRPRAYYSVEELPKNPSGKVQKFRLRSDGIDPEGVSIAED